MLEWAPPMADSDIKRGKSFYTGNEEFCEDLWLVLLKIFMVGYSGTYIANLKDYTFDLGESYEWNIARAKERFEKDGIFTNFKELNDNLKVAVEHGLRASAGEAATQY